MEKEFKLIDKEYKMINENGFKTKDVKEFIKLLKDWTFKNNTIKFKGSNLGLAVLDGGWVNVIELHNEINKRSGLNEDFPITAGDIGNGGID